MNYLALQIGQIVVGTPDLAASVKEASNLLGLQTSAEEKDCVSLTSNSRERELTYVSSNKSQVVSIGLEAVNQSTWEEAKQRCSKNGISYQSPSLYCPEGVQSLVVTGPSGIKYELHTSHPRNQPDDYITLGIRPKRLDHVNLTVPDTVKEYEFLSAIFGLQLSDKSDGDEILFLHAGDGYHHSITLVKGEAGLHHISFETNHVHDLISLADRLAHEGRTLLWGPGHHGANAKSYFTYHLDQIGCMIEYSFGMQTMEISESFQPGIWPMEVTDGEEWLNTWGAPPPGMYGDPRLPVAAN